jgi:hypothetical protein
VSQAKNALAAADSFSRRLGVLGWLVLGVAACGQAPAPPAATSRLIDTPPISKLTPDQLHGLATRCGRYAADGPARGPYDARYCEAAIAAWSDSPIQMLRLSDQPATRR